MAWFNLLSSRTFTLGEKISVLVLIKMFIITVFVFIVVLFAAGLLFIKLHKRNRKDRTYMEGHKAYMRTAAVVTIFGILLVETFVSVLGTERGWLFWVHLSFAVPFLLSLLSLVLWVTGLRFPNVHGKWGYVCIFVFYVGMLATGILLLLRY